MLNPEQIKARIRNKKELDKYLKQLEILDKWEETKIKNLLEISKRLRRPPLATIGIAHTEKEKTWIDIQMTNLHTWLRKLLQR